MTTSVNHVLGALAPVPVVQVDQTTGGSRSLLLSGGGATCVLFGDSLTYQCLGPSTASAHQLSNYGYFTHLNAKLHGGLKLLANYAVSGSTFDEWVSVQLSSVVASSARVAITLLTGNSTVAFAGTTQVEIDAEIARQSALIATIVADIRGSGKALVMGTIPPRATSGTGSFNTDAKRAVVAGVNKFAFSIADYDPLVRVVDMFRPLALYDGTPRTGVHRDSPAIHPGGMGALLIADAMYPAFAGLVSGDVIYTGAVETLLPSSIASWTANTSGTVSHTVTHGVAGPDSISDWSRQAVTSMAAAGNFSQIYSPNITTGFSVGDTLAWSVELVIESLTSVRAVDCALYFTATSNQLASCMADYSAGGITSGARDPILLSHPGTVVPAGCTSVAFRLKIVAADASSVGSVLWRAPRLVKV